METDHFSRVRRDTLALIGSLSQDQLDRRPAESKWSAGEVADHILRVERYYQQEMRELVQRARRGEGTVLTRRFADFNVRLRFLPEFLLEWVEWPMQWANPWIPDWLRQTLMEFPVLRALAPDQATPTRGRLKEDLLIELAASLDQLLSFVTENSDLQWDRLVHRHPVLGHNPLPALFRLLILHEVRHQGQIRSTRRPGEREFGNGQ